MGNPHKPYSTLSSRQKRRRLQNQLLSTNSCASTTAAIGDSKLASPGHHSDEPLSFAQDGIVCGSESPLFPTLQKFDESVQYDHEDDTAQKTVTACASICPVRIKKENLTSNDISESLETLKAVINNMNVKIEELQKNILHRNVLLKENNILLKELIVNQRKGEVPVLKEPLKFQPADTPEELDGLASNSTMLQQMVRLEDSSLCKTTTSMLKSLMTRQLAVQYSMTGLDRGRRRVKYTFGGSPACCLIERAIDAIPQYAAVPRKTLHCAIGTALKNSCDWDGNRDKRRRERETALRASNEKTANGENEEAVWTDTLEAVETSILEATNTGIEQTAMTQDTSE